MSAFKLNEFKFMTVPEESEITSAWEKPFSFPLVSIICITHNHRPYIEDAIKGFLLQKTSFPFEVVIHDDCSSDGTLDLLLKYKEKYPNIIKVISQSENQYSKGVRPIPYASSVALGEYLAICEGDDFWIDSGKLGFQAALLESNPNISLCVHNSYRLSDKEGVFDIFNKNKLPRILKSRDVVLRRWFSPTASFFLRRSVMKAVPKDRGDGANGDMLILFQASLIGDIAYDPNVRSVYRTLSVGSLSSTSSYRDLFEKKMAFYRYAVKEKASLIAYVSVKAVYYRLMLLRRECFNGD